MTSTSTEAQDLQDMERLAAGEDACLDHLIERHGPRLYRYLLRVLRSEGEAEDAAQEAFVKVYRHRARFDGRHRFSTWLYTIATNLVRDRLRRKQRRPEHSLAGSAVGADEHRGPDLKDPAPDPGEALMHREAGALVRVAIQSLPEDLRIPLILAEYDGRTHGEIGEIVGCTPKAVEMRLYRARQMLRTTLQPLLAGRGGGAAGALR